MVEQAVRDACSPNDANRAEVAVWLDSNDFKEVCLMADLNEDAIRNVIKRLLERRPALARIQAAPVLRMINREIEEERGI